jgi:cytochrome c oxidase cbb3-type subunit 3
MQALKNNLIVIVTLLISSLYLTPVWAQDKDQVAKGKQLFEQNCMVCHQADAIGKPGFAPSLTNKELLSIASDKYLLSTIRDGRPGTAMPPFAHLGREAIVAIGAYLRSFAQLPNRAAEVDAQHEARGDPMLGKVWFEEICSTCHGMNGDGYIAGGTGTAIGKPGFLNKASDGFIRTTVKYGRSNTRMLGFSGASGLANLSDKEIDDIIVYMRTLAQ